jgi:hypothetical protein
MYLERRVSLPERVLTRTPSDASIVAYAELDALRASDLLGRILRESLGRAAGFSLIEPDVDAIAVAVGSDEIVGLAAGRFPLALVRRYLEQQGATCPSALDERACSLPSGDYGGYVSIRGLEAGLVGVTTGPHPDSADRLAANVASGAVLAAEARGALEAGALVWISIDPRRLADTMSDPPEGWINLSLVARALLSAQRASLDLRDDEEREAVRATLTATCGSASDAAELSKLLESLNKLAVTALRSGGAEEDHAWADALWEGFSSRSRDREMTAEWSLPAAPAEKWLQRDPER